MIFKPVFPSEFEAWEFAKSVVANGGAVIDYGVTNNGYYIKYDDKKNER